MPCILTPCATADANFQAAVGAEFTIDVQGDGPFLELSRANYNGTTLGPGACTFTVVAGVNPVSLLVNGAAPGSTLTTVESCGDGTTNELHASTVVGGPSLHFAFKIKGV